MTKSRLFFLTLQIVLLWPIHVFSQIAENILLVRPKEINTVLLNPGIGFTSFQRFNGDSLNSGINWTEGLPIRYQQSDSTTNNVNYPQTTIAYWRVYWRYLEPEKGKYRWDMIDKALAAAAKHGQTLMLRVAPYGSLENDVPDWYRKWVGNRTKWKYNNPVNQWLVDPEDPRYSKYFGGLIREMGKRYDGHPSLESVDISIVGAWGEGGGSSMLTRKTMESLINCYTDHFKKTPLVSVLADEKTVKYAISRSRTGWRVDCIGDIGFFSKGQNGWTHMYDYYPQSIIRYGASDSWRRGPVSLEICYTFLKWKQDGFTKDQVQYIFDQTLKWHISSFNAKSSAVPPEYEPLVNDWLKKMGYRFVLRKFSCLGIVQRNKKLSYETWWENKGVAPCYKHFPLAFRLKNSKNSHTYVTGADIRKWLPGDNLCDNSFFISKDIEPGYYEVQVAIVDVLTGKPKIQLAIEGREPDGWYALGKIKIE